MHLFELEHVTSVQFFVEVIEPDFSQNMMGSGQNYILNLCTK